MNGRDSRSIRTERLSIPVALFKGMSLNSRMTSLVVISGTLEIRDEIFALTEIGGENGVSEPFVDGELAVTVSAIFTK